MDGGALGHEGVDDLLDLAGEQAALGGEAGGFFEERETIAEALEEVGFEVDVVGADGAGDGARDLGLGFGGRDDEAVAAAIGGGVA